jgi:hypothetical protein
MRVNTRTNVRTNYRDKKPKRVRDGKSDKSSEKRSEKDREALEPLPDVKKRKVESHVQVAARLECADGPPPPTPARAVTYSDSAVSSGSRGRKRRKVHKRDDGRWPLESA